MKDFIFKKGDSFAGKQGQRLILQAMENSIVMMDVPT